MAGIASCSRSDTTAHAKRPVIRDGLCTSCLRARKLHRRVTSRASTVKRLYGWTPEEVDALKATQGGRCAVCPRRVGVVKEGAMDHDHTMEAAGVPVRDTVRGILCSTCNRYAGHIRDDPEVAIKLARYLIDPPAPGVLRRLARRARLLM